MEDMRSLFHHVTFQSVRDLVEDVKQAVEYASLKFREKTGLGPDILEIIRR